jgi:predicted nucleic acid-binding protein
VDAAADVEVLQEILHRYSAAGRAADGARLYSLARRIVSTWLPVDVGVLDRARNLMTADAALGARDALHAAVYFTVGAAALCSYDRDFDRVDGLARVEPDGLA